MSNNNTDTNNTNNSSTNNNSATTTQASTKVRYNFNSIANGKTPFDTLSDKQQSKFIAESENKRKAYQKLESEIKESFLTPMDKSNKIERKRVTKNTKNTLNEANKDLLKLSFIGSSVRKLFKNIDFETYKSDYLKDLESTKVTYKNELEKASEAQYNNVKGSHTLICKFMTIKQASEVFDKGLIITKERYNALIKKAVIATSEKYKETEKQENYFIKNPKGIWVKNKAFTW